jgi:hypothetical protein
MGASHRMSQGDQESDSKDIGLGPCVPARSVAEDLLRHERLRGDVPYEVWARYRRELSAEFDQRFYEFAVSLDLRATELAENGIGSHWMTSN